MTISIAAIIPTRNRADLAMAAARSLLDQDVPIDVYVSDNSDDGAALRAFCEAEPRVQYLRPSQVIAMSEHWDWAVRQVMERSAATHFTVHYDRKLSKPNHWGTLAAAAERRPQDLFTFTVDHIAAHPRPRRLWQTPWTGRFYEIRTARLLEVLTHGRIAPYAMALPVLSNCLVPRHVLQSIVERFGDVCNSNGTDAAFMSRFVALFDRHVHYDRAMGVLYASHRSNGMGYMRGKGGDFADFQRLWGDRPWLDAAPVPGLNLGYNMLYHEYELVRRQTGDRLPPLDRDGVLNELGSFLRWVDDRKMYAQVRSLLREHGWHGSEPAPFPRFGVRDFLYQLRMRLYAFRTRTAPPVISGFVYRNDRNALAAALKYPRVRQETLEHLDALEPVEVR